MMSTIVKFSEAGIHHLRYTCVAVLSSLTLSSSFGVCAGWRFHSQANPARRFAASCPGLISICSILSPDVGSANKMLFFLRLPTGQYGPVSQLSRSEESCTGPFNWGEAHCAGENVKRKIGPFQWKSL